jgi:hypothetical protein
MSDGYQTTFSREASTAQPICLFPAAAELGLFQLVQAPFRSIRRTPMDRSVSADEAARDFNSRRIAQTD